MIDEEIILGIVLPHFGIKLSDINPKSRKQHDVYVRQVIHYLLKCFTKMYLREIAWVFRQDHSTVIHSIQTINNLMDTEEKVKEEIEYLKAKIKSL